MCTQLSAPARPMLCFCLPAILAGAYDPIRCCVLESRLQDCIPAELEAVRAWRVELNHSKAVAAYEALVAADDLPMYTEPPAMYYAPRQCLGYALLHADPPAGNATRALEVFEQDLDRYSRRQLYLF